MTNNIQSEMNQPSDSNIKDGFEKVLNSHGYGFKYSVLKRAHELFENGESQWIFEATEFPVQVQNEGTRIDFILKLKSDVDIYMIAECKRVNPALSNWCFTKVPYIRRDRIKELLLIEWLKFNENKSLYSSAYKGKDLDNAYQIALEVKSNEKGDPHGYNRGIIEESSTQICRGLNGFVEFVVKNRQIFSNKKEMLILPVVFTTANIWVSNVNLSLADINNGKVKFDNTKLDEKPWVFFQYHLSPGIKHLHSLTESIKEIGKILDSEYIRTIAVVSSKGINEFFKWTSFTYNYIYD